MEMYYLSRKILNRRLFPFLRYDLSPLLFSLSSKSLPSLSSIPQTLLLPKPCPTPILSFHQFHTNSSPDSSIPFISSTGSSSFPLTAFPSSQFFGRYNFRWFRSFSASSSGLNATAKQVSEIIYLIRRGENDLESKLDNMNVSLSEASLITIFRTLNYEKVSALRFFNWIRRSHPEFYDNSDICSLVFDNCGRLDDFDLIYVLLHDFRLHGIVLNQKAFGYLPIIVSSKAATKKSISKVVEVLNEIGGSCGLSGIHALIEMLCVLGSFEMAEYVIAKTEMRLSKYNLLIRGRCRRGHFEEAREILDRMIKVGCNPNSRTFNYLLSCLCKNDKVAEACQLLEQMMESGCAPDAITFEVFICYLCRLGMLDMALEWLDKMVSRGIEPRATTHAAFIKGYFKLQRYQEAHKYVVVCSGRYKKVSNMVYGLLASLHSKRGDPVIAQSILSEMIEKGLKPNFAVYSTVNKQLHKSGREDLARNLGSSLSSLISQSSSDNG
ncbi:pentatricopeptide repeat-containing protein At3g07290, mitochondrial-like [Durio zibethinus]|uniref:Pentatricopeptide repeat-containing protein At3g07290, mitochondrial-like n=1 Tax=Durio zibethinus TaxID=66656 RepID=A0A6P5WRK1_DURZI|nr:pentatricopeptide repeat-containing protein At3g07290, mitochondrial-like [Durio zibethinus]